MAGKHSKKLFDKDAIWTNSLKRGKAQETSCISPLFKLIVAITVLSLLVSSVLVVGYFWTGNRHSKMLLDAASIFDNTENKTTALRKLAEKNSEITAWLKIENTPINLAVCKTNDDRHYINHNQMGKKSRYGALFLSSNDTFSRQGNDRNIVIFGNNMKDGAMFGSLKNYRYLEYYKQNPVVKLYHEDQQEIYIIFAVLLVGSLSDESPDADIYNPSKSHFSSEVEFNEWYSETARRSIIKTTVTPMYDDDMLTLVTATDDFDGARLVVMAKKTTEEQAAQTDLSASSINPNVKHPKKWYEEHGLKVPY